MNRILCLFLGISFLLMSCQKSDTGYQTSGYTPPVIKGFVWRDEGGMSLRNIGNPDVLLDYSLSNSYRANYMELSSFPNPSSGIMVIYFHPFNDDIKTRLWIVPATFPGSGSEFITFSGATFSPGQHALLDTLVEQSHSDVIQEFQLRDLPEGYYRIYMKANDILLWDNIVFSKSFNQN